MPGAAKQTSAPEASPRRTLSIRVRLMILAGIAILPVVAERIYNVELNRADRIQAVYDEALDRARHGAALQDDALVSARTFLQAAATARATFDASDDQCNRYLTTIVKLAPWLNTLSVADTHGRIICSSYPGAIGLDISQRPHFTKALERSDFFLSDYFVGERRKVPFVTLSLAQRDSTGTATAVMIGLLELSWFAEAGRTFVPPSGSMLMTDSKGAVLARYPGRADLVGRRFADHPLVRNMLADSQGFVTAEDVDGVRRIFGFFKLAGTSAHIAVGFDEKTALARVNREMWMAFLELGLVAVLISLCIWFGGNRLLVRPIQALAQSAARIGRGETKMLASAQPWAAEFVPLAVAMDDMARQLGAREQELRDTNSQLRELAQIDALTGLANRRSFNERLLAEWKLAYKLRQPISVLMIDVDYFKLFNDHYGHVQGDNCLRKLAGVLRSGTRVRDVNIAGLVSDADLPPSFHRITGRSIRSDFVARYGGEEFIVLLQGADLDIARQVGERLRQGVEDLLMAHNGAPWGFVSISVGGASIVPTDPHDPQQLTEAADAALYQAKAEGRNRMVTREPVRLSHAG